MKKKSALILVFALILSLTGCGSSGNSKNSNDQVSKSTVSDSVNNTVSDTVNSTELEAVPDNFEEPEVFEQSTTISEPEIVWWHVVTETGIPTFVGEFKNNNSVPIDITFNVDYYKGSEHLYTSQDNYANAIASGESIMIWNTWEIPKDADRIEVTYSFLEESFYKPVPLKLVKEEPYDGGVSLTYSAQEDFDLCDIEAVFFNGDHAVSIMTSTFFTGEEPVTNLESVEPFDHYVLYTNCYTNQS